MLFNYNYPPIIIFFVQPFDSALGNVPLLANITEEVLSQSGLDYSLLDHPPLNEKFEEYEHESTSILIEAADTIFLFFLICAAFLCLVILRLLFSCCSYSRYRHLLLTLQGC